MLDTSHNETHPVQTNDYHQLPVTEKQLKFARFLSEKTGTVLPWQVQQDRRSLSEWIDQQKASQKPAGQFDNYASSKQVQFAERIARAKKRQVPDECIKDKNLMSRWIDCNK